MNEKEKKGDFSSIKQHEKIKDERKRKNTFSVGT
jgi:hypothetical protein